MVLRGSAFLYQRYETFKYTGALGSDLTGYYINSTKPIALFGGHACAFVPDEPITMFCDHIVEQIPPICELGFDHIVPPIFGRDSRAGYVQTLT